MGVIQLEYNFVSIDIVDNFGALPFIINFNSYKFDDFKSYDILFFINTGHLQSIWIERREEKERGGKRR